MANWHGKTYYDRKIYNEEVADELQFLELIKSQICKSYKGITRKQSDLSNEIPNLILIVLILLLKDAMLHKVGAEVYK